MELLNQFATLHPWYFALLAGVGGFLAKTFVFTSDNAKALVRWYFNWQRAKLKKAGRSPEEIKALMEGEADFLLDVAKEAKTEADAEPKA